MLDNDVHAFLVGQLPYLFGNLLLVVVDSVVGAERPGLLQFCLTTAGDETKLEKARALGADHGINHYQQKISEEVRKLTNKEGVDIVIEHVGSATWDESVKCLKPAGTLVTCGATTGFNASIDLRFLFSRQLSLLGSYMGTMSEFREVLGHVFAGRLQPVVDRVFPFAEIRDAHDYLEKSQMFGKVVLNP